ncbi:MAG: efflux RND transporter periplasmic adaptor subunit [Devosia sp.]
MRAIFSYGVALVIVLVLAVWMASGILVTGGQGPGNGERPIVSLVEKDGGPLTDTINGSGINDHAEQEGHVDPELTIAERNDEAGGGESATPRSVRIAVVTAQNMPIEVPLRGRTKAKSSVSVVAQTSGIVQTVSVKKGQVVKAGDTLCTLDQGARKLAVDQAQAAVDQAQTAYNSNLELVKKGVAASNTTLAVEAQLKGAQAGLQNAQLELDRTIIKTDVAGTVSDPMTNLGALLAMGQPCATVVELDPMLFIASVPEARIAYAKLGPWRAGRPDLSSGR